MNTKDRLKNTCSSFLIVCVAMLSFQMPASAAMVGNNELAMQSQLQASRDDVRSFMARDDVRSAMLGYGVSAADIDARINNMTQSELLKVQGSIADLPAGEGALGIVLGVILIIVLLDLLGATDIFPNI